MEHTRHRDELIAYFPFTTYRVFRMTQVTLHPTVLLLLGVHVLPREHVYRAIA
jgi:hypothetical protein